MATKPLSEEPALNVLLQNVVREIDSFAQGLSVRIRELIKVGAALSAEKDIDRLLEMIVANCMQFTNADGGTLYIKNDEKDELDFSIVRNITLKVKMGGTAKPICWPSVPLKLADGSLNHKNVATHCAISGHPVNIADVYNAEGFDFQGTRDFDTKTGYRSKSMLVIPLLDHEDTVIGVLQLLNAQDQKNGAIIDFSENEVDIVASLASQAAIAVTNVRLIRDLEELFNSFIQTIAAAIDEKSPYTSGHIRRVAKLSEMLAAAINTAANGKYADTSFSADELQEISVAAWMHDVGKITTPEQVVDKSTKLETIFDRVEAVRYRVEILKRDAIIAGLRQQLGTDSDAGNDDELGAWTTALHDDLEFLYKVNKGGEFLADEAIARIEEIGARKFKIGAEEFNLLSADEIKNLSIRRGTLTDEERSIINNHVVVTGKMLSNLPFPKKLGNVPAIAAMHHEKLDGSGYPGGISGDMIPLAARILAVADVFEALTAADRPYKPGKLMSESIRILSFMVKDNHIDEDVCDLLIESGIAADYARQVLPDRQQDAFEWKGRKFFCKG
ncbi:MAG: GAF domain-containing protein [Deltaproteobacteria bacterium]|nr:GAF domain-containing protein [Deltaproteobacteria bacterium]